MQPRGEIEDIVFQFQALQSRGIRLEISAVVSQARSAIGQLPGRRVYGRKERWEASPSEGG